MWRPGNYWKAKDGTTHLFLKSPSLYSSIYLSFGHSQKAMGQRLDKSMCYITLHKLLGWYSCIKISNTCHAYFSQRSKQYSYTWGIFSTEKVTKLWHFPYQISSQFLIPSTNPPCVYNFIWNFSWVIKLNSLTQTFQNKLKRNTRRCVCGGMLELL